MRALRLPPIGAALAVMLLVSAGVAAEGENVTRGEYLVRAGGCVSCHTAAGKS
jgi:mono/diheme cytochrome c family protein